MKNAASLYGTAAALLLAAASGFAAVPSTIWKTDDTTWQDMWNKASLDTATTFWPYANNWSVANAGTDSAMIVTNGSALQGNPPSWTNLTWKWQTDSTQKNFEIRFTWRMAAAPSGNSGFNVRGYCATNAGTTANNCGGLTGGYKVGGPQIDLGPTYTGDVWNSNSQALAQSRLATGATVCRNTGTTFQNLGLKVMNDSIYTYLYPNGFDAPKTECARARLTYVGALNATSPGYIALQYETQKINHFKNIQMRNADAIQAVYIKGVLQLSPTLYTIGTGSRSLRLGFSFAGSYAVEIADLSGRVLHKLKGHGPLANHVIPLGQPGLYIVKISSARGTALRKVVVR